MTPQRNDYDIAAIIQTALNPLMSEIRALNEKVNSLSVNGVTRSDLEKLRMEITGGYVDRGTYDAKHDTVVAAINKLEKEYKEDLQKIHERLETGKQQIEDRFKQQEEKPWVRFSQIAGYAGAALAILEYLALHFKF